jgi:hypothetical protein
VVLFEHLFIKRPLIGRFLKTSTLSGKSLNERDLSAGSKTLGSRDEMMRIADSYLVLPTWVFSVNHQS